MINKNKIEIEGQGNKGAGRDYIDNRSYAVYEMGNSNILRFFDEEIKDVIKEFAKIAQVEVGLNYDFERITAEKKNEMNNLPAEYFEEIILNESISYFQQIEDFLKSPINQEYLKMYQNTVYDLNNKIAIHINIYSDFGFVFNELFEHIFNNNKDELKSDRRLIWVMLHYMYWKCDIGREGAIGDVTTT
jgi:hypothetical protein